MPLLALEKAFVFRFRVTVVGRKGNSPELSELFSEGESRSSSSSTEARNWGRFSGKIAINNRRSFGPFHPL